ncbi:MAG: inner nuclear membrane protein enriched at telomere/subtelomere region, partial [Thelocarpon superellum]
MAAAHDPELDYLLPDFDPSTLTVARLRLILVSHDINYPSSAKKPQLIEIFNHDVVPQARKILGARSRTKRTSKGITDADPGPDEAANGTPDPHLMPPPARPRSPRKKTPRESSRPTTETPESDDLPQTTPKKTPGRRSSVKPSRVSDTESPSDATPVRPAAKKVRRSEVTPAVKVEEPEPEDATPAGDESVFSDDNPFQ